MTSTKTQLPYDYYDIAVHCKPRNGTQYKSENLGKGAERMLRVAIVDNNRLSKGKFFVAIALSTQDFK